MIHHACPNCDALQAEVDWMRTLMSSSAIPDAERILAVQGLSSPRLPMGAAKLILALYDRQGRLTSKDSLHHLIPGKSEDRDSDTLFKVYACRVRKRLGRDVIQTTWGHGYSLSPAMVSKLDALFGVKAAA